MPLGAESVLTHQTGVGVSPLTWTSAAGLSGGMKGYSPQWVGFNAGVYSPIAHQAVFWEEWLSNNTEINDAFESYSYGENRFAPLDAGENWHTENLPFASHSYYNFSYADSLNSILVWFPGSEAERYPTSVWAYDMVGRVGKDMLTANVPDFQPTATTDLAIYAQDIDTFVMLESSNGAIWHWTPSSPIWTKQTVTGTPPNLQNASGTYNPLDGKIYIFGGQVGATCQSTVYTYTPSTQTWATLTTTGGPPTARGTAGWAINPTRNVILLAGGDNHICGGSTYFTDTWTLDLTQATPTWSQPTVSGSYSNGTANLLFEDLVYDRDHDVFECMVGPTASPRVMVFALDQPSNAGTLSVTYAYPNSSSLNVGSITSPPTGDTWAYGSALALVSGSLYLSWTEQTASLPHPFSRLWTGSSWATALEVDSGNSQKAGETSLANVGGTLYMAFERNNISTNDCPHSPAASNDCMRYSSLTGTWAAASPVTINAADSSNNAGLGRIASCGGVATMIQIEGRFGIGISGTWASNVQVLQLSGGVWSGLGGALNTTANSVVEFVALDCTASNNIWAVWAETFTTFNSTLGTWVQSPTMQIYASQWNGTTWTSRGGSLNISASNWAFDPAIVMIGTTPYVAWTERPPNGTASGGAQAIPPTVMYVDSWNGTAWVAVGPQPVNRNTNTTLCYVFNSPCSWVWHPSLGTNGTNLYAAWVEQAAPSAAPQTQMSTWNGSAWTPQTGSPNADTAYGSPTHAAVAFLTPSPVVSFTETPPGLQRQVYARTVSPANGNWVNLPALAAPATIITGLFTGTIQ